MNSPDPQPVEDIAILFARDPEKMTDADIDAIVAKFRANRHLFNSSGGTAPKAPAKLTAKEAKTKADLSNLTLDLKL
jgi:hypothetical protein